MTQPTHQPSHIVFRVPCIPAGQPRPRATIRGKHAGVYTPETVGKGRERKPHPAVEFKAAVRAAFTAAYQGPPLQGPLLVTCFLVFPRPAAKVWKRKPMPREWHTAKPDRDNTDKTILDALTGLAWSDDAQVADGRILKVIADGQEQPHAQITIMRMAYPPPSFGLK